MRYFSLSNKSLCERLNFNPKPKSLPTIPHFIRLTYSLRPSKFQNEIRSEKQTSASEPRNADTKTTTIKSCPENKLKVKEGTLNDC